MKNLKHSKYLGAFDVLIHYLEVGLLPVDVAELLVGPISMLDSKFGVAEIHILKSKGSLCL